MKDTDYSMQISKSIIGKTISEAEVDGHHVKLKFDDGYVFNYDASDGGWSCYELTVGDSNE